MTEQAGIGPLLLSLCFGFACGSIPFGYLIGRLRGVDVRARGSGSIGFTNVQRSVGLAWGLPVLALDIAKGALPPTLAAGMGLVPAIVGLGCVLGHVFTPWLGFRGGKGVATALGVWGVLLGWWALPLYAAYIALLALFGYVSVASLGYALLITPVVALNHNAHSSLLVPAVATALVIILRHTDNIRRLVADEEPKLGLWLKLMRKGK